MGQEKAVCMELEREREGGRSLLLDLPGEGREYTQGKAQQKDERMGVVESGLLKDDAESCAPEGDWTPRDG